MASPWEIYDRLIEAIPGDVAVTAAEATAKWHRVASSQSGAGIAFRMPVESRPAIGSGELVGASLREVASLAKSWNFAEAAIGVAAINAWHNLPQRAQANGFSPCAHNNWAKSFDAYRDASRGRKVAVVGHFPFASKAFEEAGELFILERSPVEGDYPDPAAEYLLPDCDFVFITGSAVVNKTIPRLLELSREAVTVILGPSTPASPVFFDYGADVVTSFACGRPELLGQALAGALQSGMYEAGNCVELVRPEVGERLAASRAGAGSSDTGDPEARGPAAGSPTAGDPAPGGRVGSQAADAPAGRRQLPLRPVTHK